MEGVFELEFHEQECDRAPEFYQQRLLEDSKRVFNPTKSAVELLSWPTGGRGRLHSLITGAQMMVTTWYSNGHLYQHRLIEGSQVTSTS